MRNVTGAAETRLHLDDFVYPGSTTRYDGGMVSDSAGHLYVAGRYYFSSGPFHRFVRRSTDGGATPEQQRQWHERDQERDQDGIRRPAKGRARPGEVLDLGCHH